MNGEVGILNVGAGDTKLSFDPKNPQERIRAARIVADMIKRGYSLLIEQPPGSGKFTRAKAFDENTCEYIIADFDPLIAQEQDSNGTDQTGHAATAGVQRTEPATAQGASPGGSQGTENKNQGGRLRTKDKRIPADKTRGVAIARIAGG